MASATLYTALSLALLTTLYLLTKRRKSTPFSSLPLPPGLPTVPILGNLPQAPKSHAWLQYHAWSKTHASNHGILYLNMAGQSVIVLSTAHAAHDLLNKHGSTFSDRPRFVVAGDLALNGYHMLLRPYDERFRVHQRLEAPVLSERAAKAYLPIQNLESKQLLFDILTHSASNNGEAIDPHGHLERTTASIIYALFYGHRVRSDTDEILLEAHAVNHEFDQLAQVGRYLVDAFPVLNELPLPRFLTPWKDEAAWHWAKQCKLHVGNLERGVEGSKGWNVARQMAKAVAGMGGEGFMCREELALDIGIMADAALDASTGSLCWFVLAWVTTSQGGWVAKAQKELDRVVGRERLPGFEDRGRLGYIDAIVEEVLRWRPAGAAGAPHFTKVESSYQGYRIPANSVVIPNHWSITREEAVFGKEYDVEGFVPERFVEMETVNGESRTPGFGYGRRICPGRHVAKNSLWIAIARLLWAFDVSPEGGGVLDTKGTDGLVTKPLPFKCRFEARGDWVGKLVERGCDTWNVDHYEMLDKIALDVFK